MQGTAECNTRKTVAREYPDRHATCAQDMMLSRHDIQELRNGCMFRTALTMMLEICLYAWKGGFWRVTVSLRDHVCVIPDGCAYTNGESVADVNGKAHCCRGRGYTGTRTYVDVFSHPVAQYRETPDRGQDTADLLHLVGGRGALGRN